MWEGVIATVFIAARGGGGSQRLGQNVMNFYTDDSPGLKLSPVRPLAADACDGSDRPSATYAEQSRVRDCTGGELMTKASQGGVHKHRGLLVLTAFFG